MQLTGPIQFIGRLQCIWIDEEIIIMILIAFTPTYNINVVTGKARWHSTINTSMMASSNGSIFRVTGPLCGEFTGPGEFPAQRPVTRSFNVFFHLRLNKRFETPSWSLWRHRNAHAEKIQFASSIICQHSGTISSWNPSSRKILSRLPYMNYTLGISINTTLADALDPCVDDRIQGISKHCIYRVPRYIRA